MKRRDFIALIGGFVVARPLAAHAQQPKRQTIGHFGATTATAEKLRTDAFLQRLGELGWIEGQTIAFEYRWAESQTERFPEIAADLVRLRVDTIVATSIAAALACKKATTAIPIVFPVAGDPLGTGLVTSLARPAGNVTGLSNQGADLAGKRLEALREVEPASRKLAVLVNAEYAGRMAELANANTAAQKLGLDVSVFEIKPDQDHLAAAFVAIGKEGADALYVIGDTFMNSNRVRIGSLAAQARLPTICIAREYVEAGGLLSYGANIPHLYARAAELVDKILRGTKPGDIPVEQPTQRLRTAPMRRGAGGAGAEAGFRTGEQEDDELSTIYHCRSNSISNDGSSSESSLGYYAGAFKPSEQLGDVAFLGYMLQPISSWVTRTFSCFSTTFLRTRIPLIFPSRPRKIR